MKKIIGFNAMTHLLPLEHFAIPLPHLERYSLPCIPLTSHLPNLHPTISFLPVSQEVFRTYASHLPPSLKKGISELSLIIMGSVLKNQWDIALFLVEPIQKNTLFNGQFSLYFKPYYACIERIHIHYRTTHEDFRSCGIMKNLTMCFLRDLARQFNSSDVETTTITSFPAHIATLCFFYPWRSNFLHKNSYELKISPDSAKLFYVDSLGIQQHALFSMNSAGEIESQNHNSLISRPLKELLDEYEIKDSINFVA